jgi:peroxiredoxin/outer membrane lipoprotein-sorting protein
MADRSAFSKKRTRQMVPSGVKSRKGTSTLWVCGACFVALLLMARPAFCAAPRVGDILRKMGSTYSQLQNYHIVAVRQEAYVDSRFGSSQSSVITLDADGKGRIRMRQAGEGPNILIVNDGKTTWHYTYGKNRYTERKQIATAGGPNTPERAANPVDLLGQIEDLLVGRYVKLWQFEKQASIQGDQAVEFQGRKTPCYRVVFHLKDLDDQLWIDRSSYLVLREKTVQTIAESERRSLVTDTIRIKEIGTNAAHPAGFFSFTPPEGARRVAALNLPGIREGFTGASTADFTLKDVDGQQVRLSDFKGKTVVLTFWATWCPPCKEELPALQKILEDRKDVAVLAVDDENRGAVRDFLKEKQYSFTVLLDHKRTLFKRFGVHFIPTVFVINGQGLIIREIIGWKGPEELMAALKDAEHPVTSPVGSED